MPHGQVRIERFPGRGPVSDLFVRHFMWRKPIFSLYLNMKNLLSLYFDIETSVFRKSQHFNTKPLFLYIFQYDNIYFSEISLGCLPAGSS